MWSIEISKLSDQVNQFDVFRNQAMAVDNETVDAEKIKKFFSVSLVVETREENAQTSFISIPFVNCRLTDLEFLGLQDSNPFEKRLCPDPSQFASFASIKRKYDSKNSQALLRLEIESCNPNIIDGCQSKSQTSLLIENLLFSVSQVSA